MGNEVCRCFLLSVPLIFSSLVYNNSKRLDSDCATSHLMHDGGFTVPFVLRGSFGGASGALAGGIEFVNYGFCVIDVCQQSPVVIQYQSASPVRQEPTDRNFILRCELYNRPLSHGIRISSLLLRQPH